MTNGGWRIVIAADRCIGHGVCESLAPECIAVDEDGIARPLHDRVPEPFLAAAEAAAAACPTPAIRLLPADGPVPEAEA